MPDLRLAQSDFTIPRPQGGAPVPREDGAGDTGTAPAESPRSDTSANEGLAGEGNLLVVPFLPRPVSGTEIAMGAGLFVVLLAIFFAVKLSVTRGLQSRYAAPGPASEAGWLLFAFLAVTSLILIVCFVGDLWHQLLVVVPAGLMALLLFVLFLAKRSAALKSRR